MALNASFSSTIEKGLRIPHKTGNEARQALFAQGNKSIENVPPTQAALAQHIRRAANQACHIWGQALEPMQELPSPLRQSGVGSNHRKVGLPSGLC